MQTQIIHYICNNIANDTFKKTTDMRKILTIISLSFLLGGCQAKNESSKAAEEQNATAAASATDNDTTAGDNASVGDTVVVSEDDIMDISEMPANANRQDNFFQYAVYTHEERTLEDYDNAIVYSVWLADERTGTVRKVCETNPKAQAQWERMRGEEANGVAVELGQIAGADKAWIAPGDVSKVIVEGCPDARNIWTYIIDTDKMTAIQLPSTEGVVELDHEKKEIITASYGYFPEGGRYTYQRAYDTNGKFIRVVSEKTPE